METGSRQENASNQESRAPLRFHRSGKGSRIAASPRQAAGGPRVRAGLWDRGSRPSVRIFAAPTYCRCRRIAASSHRKSWAARISRKSMGQSWARRCHHSWPNVRRSALRIGGQHGCCLCPRLESFLMLAPNAQRPGKVALVRTLSADRWLRFTAARLPRTLLQQRKVKNPHGLSDPPMFCGSPMLTPAPPVETRTYSPGNALEDAPTCSECGMLMVPNGACYKCENCGSTSGCS